MPTRTEELLASTPPTTMLFTALCVGTYLLQTAGDLDSGGCAIGAYPVLYQWQWYRILSSALCHGGIMHIGMNMMSFYMMGCSLERMFGSVAFFVIQVVFMVLAGCLYVGACWVLALALSDLSWLHYYSVGYSGIIFANAAQESFLSDVPTRSVFGLFTVPTRLYPWALLVLLQVLMPNISFLGHLSGLVVGLLHVNGKLGWALPSLEGMHWLEARAVPARVRAMGGFAPVPDVDRVEQVASGAGEPHPITQAIGVIANLCAPCTSVLRPFVTAVCTPLVSTLRGTWQMFRPRGAYSRVPDAEAGAADGGEPSGPGPGPVGPDVEAGGGASSGGGGGGARTYGRGTLGGAGVSRLTGIAAPGAGGGGGPAHGMSLSGRSTAAGGTSSTTSGGSGSGGSGGGR